MNPMAILEQTYFGNTVLQWTTALVVAVVVLVTIRIFKAVAVRRLRKLAERSTTNIDDLIVDLLASTKFFLILGISLYAGTMVLDLPGDSRDLVTKLAVLIFLMQATLWGNYFIKFLVSQFVEARLEEDASTATMVNAFGFVARLIFFSVVFLVALGTVGFDISGLVTTLGIGGIAVALAVKDILSDLFGSLTIALDKPFVLGDFITTGDYAGTVEHIGLKTTRLRSSTGEQLVFSNADLLGSRLRNYKRMDERRALMNLGVTYDTSAEKLSAIPSILEKIIDKHELARFNRAHFAEFGASSLDFQVVFWVTKPGYQDFMDTRQAINMEIYRRFAAEGIEFAYPTQTLYVEKGAGEETSA
jgi:small-conductance mechanosensitive channel